MKQHAQQQQAVEQSATTHPHENTEASETTTATSTEQRKERRKELMDGSTLKQLQQVARQLGVGEVQIEAAEDSDTPKAGLVDLVILYETTVGKAGVTPPHPPVRVATTTPAAGLVKHKGTAARPPPPLPVARLALDTLASKAAEPVLALVSTAPTMNEATAARKVQAVFRGKQARARAMYERESVSNQRRLKDLRNCIMLKQATLTTATVVAILVTVIIPAYTTQGPDIDFGVTFMFWFMHLGFGHCYLGNAVFSLALGDTGGQFSGRVTVLLTLITATAFLLWLGNFAYFYNPMKPDNADADVRLIKGTASTILGYVGFIGALGMFSGTPQCYQMFLLRNVKVPPARLMTLWQISRESPGMLVGAVTMPMYLVFCIVYSEMVPSYRWHTMESIDEFTEW
jgi:hypothetical protein